MMQIRVLAFILLSWVGAAQAQNKTLFEPLQNGLKFKPTIFVYDLESNPKRLKIFEHFVDSESIKWARSSKSGELEFFWPRELIPFGQFEAIGASGNVIWSLNLDPKELEEWRQKNAKSEAAFGIKEYESDQFDRLSKLTKFKICLTNKQKLAFARLCTGNVFINKKGQLEKFAKASKVKVYVYNETANVKGELQINQDQEIQFFAQTEEGASYEFLTKPHNLNLVDFYRREDGKIQLVGHTNFPLRDAERVKSQNTKGFLAKIGWLPTIGDNREYWKATREESKITFFISGDGGGLFQQEFEIEKAPTEKNRVYLDERSPTSTYVNSPRLYGKVPKGYIVKSSQNSAKLLDAKDSTFEWYTRATEKDKDTFSVFTTEKDGEAWTHTFGVYRSRPIEISGRLTGIATGEQMILLGELAYNHWFETLFGLKSYYLSQQRWGYSVKLFKSLAGIKQKDSTEMLNITAMTADLKYRLTPGTWGRDETWGLIAGYTSVQVNQVVGPMLGVGFFWARSMPKVFDDLFNILPIMRYPKWVDLEYIHYVSGLNSNVQYGTNYALNFHGKVLWTPSFFGEAGFGAKSTQLMDIGLNQKTEFISFYGTAGLGFSF